MTRLIQAVIVRLHFEHEAKNPRKEIRSTISAVAINAAAEIVFLI